MIQGLQLLCGVVLLTVLTAWQAWGAEAVEIRLHRGTPLEERGRDQLRRLLRMYDLRQCKPRHNVVYLSADVSRPYRVIVNPRICIRGLFVDGSLILPLWG